MVFISKEKFLAIDKVKINNLKKSCRFPTINIVDNSVVIYI